jgi:hypothetical protein
MRLSLLYVAACVMLLASMVDASKRTYFVDKSCERKPDVSAFQMRTFSELVLTWKGIVRKIGG